MGTVDDRAMAELAARYATNVATKNATQLTVPGIHLVTNPTAG